MSLRVTVLLACLLLGESAAAFATDYYVSPAGNDGHVGTSATSAWRTLARVNAATLLAGDRVLLQGGQTFAGNLVFGTSDGGTPASPLTLMSYGSGRATIASASGKAILVYNRAAIRIRHLNVVGAMAPGSTGISCYTDVPGTAPLAYVRIDYVDVSGFESDGVQIGSWGGAGFRDVRITYTTAHDNGRTGLFTFADKPNVLQKIYIGHSAAWANRGLSYASTNTGSGIVLGGVNGGTIERSVAHDNGGWNTASEGPGGIWTYDSTRVLIQHNESYANHTGGRTDGNGFDLDQNVSYSTLQFNYSHDNDGAGYLFAHRYANDAHTGNVVRFNVSQNDGRKNGYGAIEIWGRTVNAAFFHNVVYLSPAVSGAPSGVHLHNAGISGVRSQNVRILNNILYTTGTAALVDVSSDQLAAAPAIFAGNVYFGASTFRIAWGGTAITGLTAFRNLGQEQVSGMPTGLAVNPGLQAPGAGPTFGDATKLETLDAYRLATGSPVTDHGVALGEFGLTSASTDYFGTSLSGVTPDPGVHEADPFGADAAVSTGSGPSSDIVMWASDATAIAGNWLRVADSSAAGGLRVQNLDRGAAKLTNPAASPASYVELTFNTQAGVPYRLWVRSIAQNNSYANDSVFVQFSGSVTATGTPTWRIGTTSATTVILEDCSGCWDKGWGWQDNGYGTGVLGPLIYFATAGPQTIRLQPREDGLGIDQVVLSPTTYLTTSPGKTKLDTTILPRQ